MKISKLFHWLYASVMMLPLFASIVFAIYTRNENSTYNQSVEYQINKLVNFNQYAYNGDFSVDSNWYTQNGLTTISNGLCVCSTFNSNTNYGLRNTTYSFVQGHTYLIRFSVCLNDSPSINECRVRYPFISSNFEVDNNLNTFNFIGVAIETSFYCQNVGANLNDYYFKYVNFFDLTQMFGVGNEPNINQFDTWYPNDYYAYNTGTKQLLHDYSTETYNNTDVGSQLIYTLYNSTNNYFNVTDFLGLNNLYDWISINVFNGTPALAFSLFYMLLSYWLLVSIFWLVFDIVMYVPNLAHRWLDKGSLQ